MPALLSCPAGRKGGGFHSDSVLVLTYLGSPIQATRCGTGSEKRVFLTHKQNGRFSPWPALARPAGCWGRRPCRSRRTPAPAAPHPYSRAGPPLRLLPLRTGPAPAVLTSPRRQDIQDFRGTGSYLAFNVFLSRVAKCSFLIKSEINDIVISRVPDFLLRSLMATLPGPTARVVRKGPGRVRPVVGRSSQPVRGAALPREAPQPGTQQAGEARPRSETAPRPEAGLGVGRFWSTSAAAPGHRDLLTRPRVTSPLVTPDAARLTKRTKRERVGDTSSRTGRGAARSRISRFKADAMPERQRLTQRGPRGRGCGGIGGARREDALGQHRTEERRTSRPTGLCPRAALGSRA